MNIHQPLVMNKIQKNLDKVAKQLDLIGADDWAEDVRATAFAIKQEWEEEKDSNIK